MPLFKEWRASVQSACVYRGKVWSRRSWWKMESKKWGNKGGGVCRGMPAGLRNTGWQVWSLLWSAHRHTAPKSQCSGGQSSSFFFIQWLLWKIKIRAACCSQLFITLEQHSTVLTTMSKSWYIQAQRASNPPTSDCELSSGCFLEQGILWILSGHKEMKC